MAERSVGSCPTCGKNAVLTKEHVYPDWLLREIGAGYEAAILSICGSCNSRLAKVFEDKTSRLMKPMLHGDPATLTIGKQKLLAGWFCKTAILLALREYQNPTLTKSTRLDQYVDAVRLIGKIMQHRRPPPRAYVRISRYDQLSISNADFQPPGPPPPTSFFAMGLLSNIVYEVFVTRAGIDTDAVLGAYEVARKEAGNDAWSIRIWPQPGPVTWPPVNTLGPRELVEVEHLQTVALRAARGDRRPLQPLQDRVLGLERQVGRQDVPGPESAARPGT